MKLLIQDITCTFSNAQTTIALEHPNARPVIVEIGELNLQEEHKLLTYRDALLIKKIESVIIEMIHHSDELPAVKYSDYISHKLNVHYTYLSKLFSKARNITIERFIIAHKIERVKELLLHNELTLSEIAWKLHYSSTAHLSAQFKKVTGLSFSLFKKSVLRKSILPMPV